MGVVALAFGVRLLYLYQIEAMPFFYHPVGDAASYWDWAGRIAGGDWLGTEPFYQAPAYPYFLALARLVVGDDLWRVRVVQLVLGAVSCGLLAMAGRWFIARGAGLCAGLVVALYGPAIFFDGLIQKATLSLFLMSVLLCLLGWIGNVPHPLRREGWGTLAPVLAAFFAGVVLGVLALTREQALLLGAVVLVWLLSPTLSRAGARQQDAAPALCSVAPCGRRTLRPTFRHPQGVTLLVLGMALVLGVVGWRNHKIGGELSLTTFQAGPNFYIGNHDGATGRYVALKRGHEAPPFEREDATELAEAAVGRSLTPREVSNYWLGRAWDFIKRHPARWVSLLLYKWMLVWNAYEIPDTESYTLYAHLSWLLALCGGINHFGVLCPLAAVGVVATARRWRELWLLYAMIATVALGVAVFYVFGRYRYPLVPLLAIFAGAGLCELRRVLQKLPALVKPSEPRASARADAAREATGPSPESPEPDRQMGERTISLRTAVLLVLAVAIATNLPLNPERELDGMAYANLGVVLGQQQKYTAAIYFLEHASEHVPDSVETHYNLGMAYGLTRDYERALLHFRRAQELDPELMAVDFQMATVYEARGQLEDAIRHYERALKIDPRDESARSALARLRDARVPGRP